MANPQLVDYIRTQLAQGYTIQQLKTVMMQSGYTSQEIDYAISLTNHKPPSSVPQQKQQIKDSNKQINNSGSSKIKKRNPFLVFLFSFITLGIYSIFWFVYTTNELKSRTKSAPNPLLLWLMLIPFVNIAVMIYYCWKYSKAINELTGFSNIALFLLWVVFSPVAMILSQMELNKKAG